jgi:hypothetical protein
LNSAPAPAIAYNPLAREYGVVFRSEKGLYFVRLDRFGGLVHPASRLAPTLLTTGPDATMPDLAHAGKNRWAATYHHEGSESSDQSHVVFFDDEGAAIADCELAADADSEDQSVGFDAGQGLLITSTDVGGVNWTTAVQQFDATSMPGLIVDAVDLHTSVPTAARAGRVLPLPGLSNEGGRALVTFNLHGYQMVQLVDLATGQLAWSRGQALSDAAGRIIPGPPKLTDGDTVMSALAWSPEAQLVAYAYSTKQQGNGLYETSRDIYLVAFDPLTAAPRTGPVHLNAALPGQGTFANLAWDGTELLAVWSEASPGLGSSLQMARFALDGSKNLLQKGAAVPYASGAPYVQLGAYHSAVGHDGVHAIAYATKEAATALATVSVCIEPPYPAEL